MTDKKFNNYRVLSKWSRTKSLAVYLDTNEDTLKKYNMLYVIQSVADKHNDIYKVGISSGLSRIKSYVSHHGDERKLSKNRCAGVTLIYLAGTKRPEFQTSRAEAALLDGYALKAKWAKLREEKIKKTLESLGHMPSVRGTEWFGVKMADIEKFKKIVTGHQSIKTDVYVAPRVTGRIRKKKVITSV